MVAPTQNGMNGGVYPYGSTTPLGYARAGKAVIEEETFEIVSEARGRRVGGGRGITRSSFAMVMQQYDATVLAQLYATTTVSGGGFQGAFTLTTPDPGATQQPGVVTPGSALLVASEDPSLPSLLIYAPRYSHGGRKELQRSINLPYEDAVVVYCDDDASGRDYAVDILENLAL